MGVRDQFLVLLSRTHGVVRDHRQWGDSNLSLARSVDSSKIRLPVEHRAAPSREPLALCLRSPGDSVPLAIIPSPPPPPLLPAPSSDQRLVEALTASRAPLRLSPLREPVGLRHQTVSHPMAIDGQESNVSGGRIALHSVG